MPEAEFSLDSVSVLLVWTAIAIYALAFVAYAVDLARRSDLAVKAKDAAPVRELVAAGGSTISRVRAQEDAALAAVEARPGARPRYIWARIGTSLTVLGFLFHVGADITRGIAAGRVPWSNMYEFALTGTMLIIAVYLFVLLKYDLRFLGTFITGLVTVLLGATAIWFYTIVVPLSDPLKSVWLVIHVFVASLATALFALAFALSVTQLLQARRERLAVAADEASTTGDEVAVAGAGAAGAAGAAGKTGKTGPRFLRTLPSSDALESLAYRFAIIGFIFWTFTLIAGSIWANDAWGRYWGFDTKEVWTFVIWVLYAGYIHARATRGWRGTRSAWLSIVGFAAVMFNFTIVNMFFKGLHVYSGLS
ncbi:MAG: c-type cytochrome biogenesis protein CcsB [Microbacterium sp. SCN 70-200]|uniref:c-type cytochrome biogenesis protein CcsB n=1 Tax=unclassified Microbacterium TaxID=2609290 RepID=UPI00086B6A6B|nr:MULTISPECIES: c-type cytochrome biogenesis protein CcsB [unclassified Microbacterium]MBN9215663.1 c-type cytochrome biogenesis protein CcsB [Microbacterium sp.]ODT41279.1 MAG: c-type cytochrome biogenesis protein CcsB [Microbacterium sp. SCN 70-200]OJV81742.1 MAG: c-type cytochrome biogenesis protein CcsB [Microbacterium sp. 70-16]